MVSMVVINELTRPISNRIVQFVRTKILSDYTYICMYNVAITNLSHHFGSKRYPDTLVVLGLDVDMMRPSSAKKSFVRRGKIAPW
jgi:hypothetical protein